MGKDKPQKWVDARIVVTPNIPEPPPSPPALPEQEPQAQFLAPRPRPYYGPTVYA